MPMFTYKKLLSNISMTLHCQAILPLICSLMHRRSSKISHRNFDQRGCCNETHNVEHNHEGRREFGGDPDGHQPTDGEGAPEAGGQVGALGGRQTRHHLPGVAVDVAAERSLGGTPSGSHRTVQLLGQLGVFSS